MEVQEIIALCIVALAAFLLVRHLAGGRDRPAKKNCDTCRCGDQTIEPVSTDGEKYPRRL